VFSSFFTVRMNIFGTSTYKNPSMENSEIILKTLKENGALKSGEIAEKSGLAKTEVDKVIKKLVSEEKVHSPKRCFYDVK
jgi:predicted transcriptional regulator